jgi:hypothetical protein
VDCDPSIYVWEIETENGGTFDEVGDGDYTRTYNAPTCGAGCVNTVKINLYCDTSDNYDSIEITIYPCPKNAAITYTTQQMQVSESQTLGIDKGDGQCGTGASWLWEILEGGGSLSDPTSPSGCTYTAPASNENCEQNPTIALSCDGVVMDTLDIAVNGSSNTTNPAYRQAVGFSEFQCYFESNTCKWVCAVAGSFYYNCDGTFLSAYSSGVGYLPRYSCGSGGGMGVGGACDAYYGVNCCSSTSPWCESKKDQYCTACSTAAEATALLGGADLRTAAMKTAGCCPAVLL